MDLSAVIFVAVAVAWAVYLVPKALRHHDEAHRSRSVERFSHTVRVLARREAVSPRDARLVVPQRGRRVAATDAPGTDAPGTDAPGTEAGNEPGEVPAPPTAAELRARRMTARRATKRRRRVLAALLVANAVVAALAIAGVVAVAWPAVPAGLLVAWLGVCRVMVRGEHAAWDSMTASGAAATRAAVPDAVPDRGREDAGSSDGSSDGSTDVPADYGVEANDQGFAEVAPAADTTGLDVVPSGQSGPALWDPVPVTLPTYVHKATAARRSVRTIDLDATGVWTSGRTDEDARIAQASAKRAARESGGDGEHAVGS